jgi:hypothetical protein
LFAYAFVFSVTVSGDPEPPQHRTSELIEHKRYRVGEEDCVPQNIEIASSGHDLCEERINGRQPEIVGTPVPAGIAEFTQAKRSAAASAKRTS